MEVIQILDLLSSSGPISQPQRQAAEEQLKAFENQNTALYLHALATQLNNEQATPDSREFAGIMIKNGVSVERDPHASLTKAQRWMHIPIDQRAAIKSLILASLHTAAPAPRHTASLACAKIGVIELERKEWQDLISVLLDNMRSGTDFVKHGTLETLGYLCEDISPEAIPESLANSILTAIVSGMALSGDIKRVAIVALLNSLRFVRANFNTEPERDYIMRVILSAAADPDIKVRRAAYECLVKVAENYYDKLPGYIISIYEATMAAISAPDGDEVVALQAIEFWSSVSDEEISILDEQDDLPPESTPPRTCHTLIARAITMPGFIDVITATLTKQDEDADSDTWNPAMAAGACLGLIASAVGDGIVPVVMPFINLNIKSPKWRNREAATLAFGSILEGPRAEAFASVMNDAITTFVEQLTTDPNEAVRDTTAWTLGRIAELHPDAIKPALHVVINVLGQSLTQPPKVANSAAWALHNVICIFSDEADESTSPLSKYFFDLLSALLATADREDDDDNFLRPAAYETIGELIHAAPADCRHLVNSFVPKFLERLQATFSPDFDKEQQNQLQTALCCTLEASLTVLALEYRPYLQPTIQLLFSIFQTKTNTVHEEALSLFGALIQHFEDIVPAVMPQLHNVLILGLRSHEESSVCLTAVGVVGDVCRAIGDGIVQYSGDLIGALMFSLQIPTLNKQAKCACLAAFGDIALALGGKIDHFLQFICPVLQDASQLTVDTSYEENVEFLNLLRSSVLDAYTGIISGLSAGQASVAFLPYLQHLLGFIEYVWRDPTRDKIVLAGLVGIIGDIADAMGSFEGVAPVLRNQLFATILGQTMQLDDEKLQLTASWAHQKIESLP